MAFPAYLNGKRVYYKAFCKHDVPIHNVCRSCESDKALKNTIKQARQNIRDCFKDQP